MTHEETISAYRAAAQECRDIATNEINDPSAYAQLPAARAAQLRAAAKTLAAARTFDTEAIILEAPQ